MPNLGPTELIIIAVVIMLLFGAKKMPDAARSLGRSMRIFKAETKNLHGDEEDKKQKTSSEQDSSPSEPQQLNTAKDDAVDGKVVGRDQAHQESR